MSLSSEITPERLTEGAPPIAERRGQDPSGNKGRAPGDARRRHWLRWIFVGAAVALLISLVIVIGLFVVREDPGAKDINQAIDEYRSTSVVSAPSEGVRPEAGVYQTEAEGHEELSFPPLDQVDGAVAPLTIEHLAGGCWRSTIDFNEAHSQSWEHCLVDGRIVELGGRTFQRWDLGASTVENRSTFECDPVSVIIDPAAEPGATWSQACTGTNTAIAGATTSEGSYTYVGLEHLDVGGQPVEVRHFVQERSITGAQEGTERVESWFRADGLPVRMERTVEVATDSPVGGITYRESGHWQLTSVDPTD